MTNENTLISAVRTATASLVSALAAYDAANVQSTPTNYNLVLIGDSRLNGDWNVLLGRTDILNLSVAGSKATDWLANWQANVQTIINSGAKKVIVQYGKNEVDAGKSVPAIAHDIQDVVAIIGNHTTARVGVLGTLPVSDTVSNATALNVAINQLQGAIPPQVASASPSGFWYQGYQNMVSGGYLISAYTNDGSHLNENGKQIYKNSIATLEAMIP